MARPVWSGTISFGMVAIPVKLVPAVRHRTVRFNQLDADSMARIRYRKVSEATGEEVPAERIVRAVNLGRDQYVVVEPDEIDALLPARSQEITIDGFVPIAQIDPIVYESSYHVLPETNVKPYALLAHALHGTERVGVGRFVMRQREHIAAIRSEGQRLQLLTLAFARDLVDTGTLDEFSVLDSVAIGDHEAEMAESLLEAMSIDFDHAAYADEFHEALDELVQSKASGAEPVATAQAEERGSVIDLAEALQQSLAAAGAAKGRHPSSRGARKSAATKKATPAKKAPAEKPSVKKSPAKKTAERPRRKSA